MKILLAILSLMFVLSSCSDEQKQQKENISPIIRPEIIRIIKSYININQQHNIPSHFVKLETDSITKDTSSYIIQTIISETMFNYYPSSYFYIDSTMVFVCDGARGLYNHSVNNRAALQGLINNNIDTSKNYKIYCPLVWKIYITKDTIVTCVSCNNNPKPITPAIKFNPPKI